MLLPIFLLAGIGIFSFFGGKGALYVKAVEACKAQNAHGLFDVAESFRKKGDSGTAAMLTDLGMRMQSAQNGAPPKPQSTFDPDNTGNPALEELGAKLWNLESRIPVLKGWSAAYLRCDLPVMAGQLSVKCAQLSNYLSK